jgi:hypothetical protein
MKLQQQTQSQFKKAQFDDDSPIDDSPIDDKDEPIDDLGTDDIYNDLDSSSSTMQKYTDLLKDMTNFNPILKDVVNSWLAISWDEKKQKYERIPETEPLMNLKGAMWCISYLKTYAKKTNFITHLSEKEYEWLYIDINRVVWIDFATRDDFGVKNNQDYHRIGMELVHGAILVITGAGGGKYNQFFSSTTTRHENISNQPQQNMAGNQMMPMQKKKMGMLQLAKRLIVGGQ